MLAQQLQKRFLGKVWHNQLALCLRVEVIFISFPPYLNDDSELSGLLTLGSMRAPPEIDGTQPKMEMAGSVVNYSLLVCLLVFMIAQCTKFFTTS